MAYLFKTVTFMLTSGVLFCLSAQIIDSGDTTSVSPVIKAASGIADTSGSSSAVSYETISDTTPRPAPENLSNEKPVYFETKKPTQAYDEQNAYPSQRSRGYRKSETRPENISVAANTGTAVFFLGLVADWVIALPMTVTAVQNQDAGMAAGSSIVGLLSGGLKICGSTVACVNGSRAYDFNLRFQDAETDKSSHWVFYQIGFVCAGGALLTNLIRPNDYETAMTLGTFNLIFNITRDVMWSIASIKSSVYAGKTAKRSGRAKFSLAPTYDSGIQQGGLKLSLAF